LPLFYFVLVVYFVQLVNQTNCHMGSLKQELIQKLSELGDTESAEELKKATDAFLFPKAKVWKGNLRTLLMFTSFFLAAAMLVLLIDLSYQNNIIPVGFLLAYAAWVIVPPTWFLFEYVWIFPDDAKMDPNKAADMKYTQELAGKIWAALVVLIGAGLYLVYPLRK
jgi:hypothetical protein